MSGEESADKTELRFRGYSATDAGDIRESVQVAEVKSSIYEINEAIRSARVNNMALVQLPLVAGGNCGIPADRIIDALELPGQ
ncbi:MAG: hypothetical protein ITG02_15190 [Patulibacter sp.]|nr:hypothetical protein [Patulibacter sp.]